ncbi:M20 family metallo-hydrolase [Shouchella shacheensis]|uniref:M20 family metallo-hydrolase n=1 Tax=Shouchella shacheensis TaxID=1649580 RepID=UPI00073FE5B3|nr:M20 family metallo-hydrolase [Shouchella shacheensis]
MNIKRIEDTLNEFNKIGYSRHGMNRLAFTKEEEKVKRVLIELCEKEGMEARIDHCGNVIMIKEGKNPNLAPVIIGSHLDTVYNGGQYDGSVGVGVGVEIICSINDRNIQPERRVELICFVGEEASRFGMGTIGSSAMAGKFDQEVMSRLTDQEGVSFPKAVENVELDFETIRLASREGERIHAFFEVHIEQGPVLENHQKKIGVVTAIAAPTRLKVTIVGKASHSGTTPMNYRKDALLGASEIALTVEEAAKLEAVNGTVATVGQCSVFPGAMNVVPGRAEMKIDIRGTNVESKQVVVLKLLECFKDLKNRRHLDIQYEYLVDKAPVKLDTKMINSLSTTCEELGVPHLQMVSGAGHDAMNMASICPTGLLFIPCKEGLSHHKNEFASIEDIAIGAQVLEHEILKSM